MIALASILATAWLLSGVLAWRGPRAAAAALLVLCAAPLFMISVRPLWQVIADRSAYVRQYGSAALADLPSTTAVCALSLLAMLAAVLSLRQRPLLLWLGWLALAPVVAFALYLAFAFRIFG